MFRFEGSLPMAASVASIWQRLIDFPAIPTWEGGVLEVRQVSAGPPGIGTELVARRVYGSREATVDCRITDWDDGHAATMSIRGGPIREAPDAARRGHGPPAGPFQPGTAQDSGRSAICPQRKGDPLTGDHETGSIVAFDDLAHTEHAHEFVGAEHGDVPFSVILVHSQPGVGPKLHRHPYAEVFVVEAGQATFQIGEETVVVNGGHVVVSPPGEAHGFTNTGAGELRLTAIHGAGRFDTAWLAGPDPAWTSKPTG